MKPPTAPQTVPLRPIDLVALSALSGCRFVPGSWPKRFVRTMVAQVKEGGRRASVRQLFWIWKLCYTFRRQIHGEALEEVLRRHTKPAAWIQKTLF